MVDPRRESKGEENMGCKKMLGGLVSMRYELGPTCETSHFLY